MLSCHPLLKLAEIICTLIISLHLQLAVNGQQFVFGGRDNYEYIVVWLSVMIL
jgi:hypothetical protein